MAVDLSPAVTAFTLSLCYMVKPDVLRRPFIAVQLLMVINLVGLEGYGRRPISGVAFLIAFASLG